MATPPRSASSNGAAALHSSDGDAALVSLCHDLRQYVSASLLLSRMPGDDDLPPDVRERLQLIHQQLQHVGELIAAARSGDEDPRNGPVDLAALAWECVDVVRLTHTVSVEVEIRFPGRAWGDPVLLRRALMNMLDNAARAVSHDGTVTVVIGGGPNEAWLEVVDDGVGFGQVSSGTGHGLATVQAAVRASQGRLEISSGPGPGTHVKVVLPSRPGIGPTR